MKSRKIIFIVIIVYNLIGLISLLGLYPGDPLYSDKDWIGIFFWLSFPIIIISFGYRFAQAEPLYPIFIIQFIMLLVSIYISNSIMRKREKSE